MKILIVEDEPHAARQLQQIILECRPQAVIAAVAETVEQAVRLLRAPEGFDLIFLDIHLADGHSFEIFNVVDVQTPVIFTTAYDQYAIKAFEVNSVDYLLKPVNLEIVEKALMKFEKRWQEAKSTAAVIDIRKLRELLFSGARYRENFLIPFQDKLLPVAVKDIAWFDVRNGRIAGTQFNNTSLVLEERSIDELMEQLDPWLFYRANRQYLINRYAIKTVTHHFNGKLLASLQPAPTEPVIISREKASGFKIWMGS
ncbi:LytR/AlgR family response regulator transcription factor [Pseudobacter ginsenosidimutans]|uniref:LytTR family two component transcriptional regulator n=1 Tax=Pseudobacter ginsenosidimutans TaxID=661488 RepID=A0A4Q7N649_9BACT|nr:LytTR family DNA-binding domain-containing protein [Pseudobacter ginsenosidimutans]QEC45059.1 response regulator transcription factor [Pseudobacter ginsenosidimutans]RZS76554.1 LytTR family two component transcriptional regulator [Pseudobacter ginsenosidimutans]